MNDLRRCPRCRAPLAADVPLGLCPLCLLEQGLRSHEQLDSSGDDATARPPGAFIPPAPAELAASFPQLEVQELLGHGGMGAVYRARQKSLDRLVALKILPPQISGDPAFAERFQREARTLARLNHPNIVIIYEFGKANGYYYLLMEYVDGVNLRQAIQAKTLAPAKALAVVRQICDALQYAHEEGVVHRDIKPENLLLDKRGRVKIADFGLAKLLGRTPVELTLTASHQIMGTLHYMAPEQFDRPLTIDHRADIYSLGVVFYELLTGELPLGRFPLPSEAAPVDARLDDVVLKTLERRPEARYQHASDVKTDVEAIAAGDHPQRTVPRRPPASLQVPAHSQVEQNLQKAAVAMLGVGGANVLLPVLAHVLILLAAMTDMLHPADVDDFFWLFFSVPAGLVTLLGGWCMYRRVAYPLAILGIVTAMVPCGPVWLASLPVAVLAFLALRQPGAAELFSDSWNLLTTIEPVKAGIADWIVRDRLHPPAVTLIVMGATNLIIPVLVNLAQFFDHGRLDDDFFPLFLSVPTGVLMIAGGAAMLRVWWYGLAMSGVIAAMVPCGPVWIVSLFAGVWALIVLRREDVRAAFGANVARPAPAAAPVDVAAIRRHMRGPGMALAATALLGLVILAAVTAVCGYFALNSPSRYDDAPAFTLMAILAWNFPLAGLMALGGWKMRNLELYALSLSAAIIAVLPIHSLVIVTLPVGVWALALLARREVRGAFAQVASGEEGNAELPAEPPRKPNRANEEVRRKLALPALGLLLAGIVDALVAAGLAGALAMDIRLDLPDWLGFTLLFSSLTMGLVLILAGTKMLRFRSYYLALLVSMLAIAPTSPAWPLSLAFGINSLVLLTSRSIRREFEVEKRRLEDLGLAHG